MGGEEVYSVYSRVSIRRTIYLLRKNGKGKKWLGKDKSLTKKGLEYLNKYKKPPITYGTDDGYSHQ